jgi:hypothetical protein
MLRSDLAVAGIPYRDTAGQVYDFHSLRCQCATLADAAGVSPRVVQRLMRHSTLELTGRYTRPRAVDIERAVEFLPSLGPTGDGPTASALPATGTDGKSISKVFAHHLPTAGDGRCRDVSPADVIIGSNQQSPMTGLAPEKTGDDASCRSNPVAVGRMTKNDKTAAGRDSIPLLFL